MAKALSIIEPYATLIRLGLKHIETRSWKTKYRGTIYIHASKRRVPKEWRMLPCYETAKENGLNFGSVVCKAELVDCYEMTEEIISKMNNVEKDMGFWAPGRYAWVLDNIEPVDPFLVKGHLGVWNLNLD